mmetsp:Transcript_29269/g.69520  ORF Transcript_29269/g.69520 Transcript_29269/m.69520 type:complete len:221 (+) Transcript_29269:952-1614(+)
MPPPDSRQRGYRGRVCSGIRWARTTRCSQSSVRPIRSTKRRCGSGSTRSRPPTAPSFGSSDTTPPARPLSSSPHESWDWREARRGCSSQTSLPEGQSCQPRRSPTPSSTRLFSAATPLAWMGSGQASLSSPHRPSHSRRASLPHWRWEGGPRRQWRGTWRTTPTCLEPCSGGRLLRGESESKCCGAAGWSAEMERGGRGRTRRQGRGRKIWARYGGRRSL